MAEALKEANEPDSDPNYEIMERACNGINKRFKHNADVVEQMKAECIEAVAKTEFSVLAGIE